MSESELPLLTHRRLGASGLEVSTLSLGTMAWGHDTDQFEAQSMLELFLEAGGSTIDTAHHFMAGASEEVIGTALAELKAREQVTLVSKAGICLPSALKSSAASLINQERRINNGRKVLLAQLEESLRRLQTDYLDLWLVQAADPYTPLEETLSALEIALSSGKVRYVGWANLSGWQLTKAALTARLGSASVYAPVQLVATGCEYSLLNRQAEAELIPAAQDAKIGLFAWNALGRGVLTGRYQDSIPATSRGASPYWRNFVAPYLNSECASIVSACQIAADGLERSLIDLCISWTLHHCGFTSAIIGPRTVGQLRQILEARLQPLPTQVLHALNDIS